MRASLASTLVALCAGFSVMLACGSDDGATGADEGLDGGDEGGPNPLHSNGVKDEGETDVDCGGTTAAARCANSKACLADGDCSSTVCRKNTCVDIAATNGVQDNGETDVDCGGMNAPNCDNGGKCATDEDCTSTVCTLVGALNRCAPPSHDDAHKNLDETDVDCGGTAPKCLPGKTCKVHADCATDGCDYSGHCALAPSCTQHHGGDTCGAGDEKDPTRKHESCCTALAVPDRPLRLDKYQVTAGRMRVFLERVDGNVQKWVQEHRATLPAYAKASLPEALDTYLPTKFTGDDAPSPSVARLLGGSEFTTEQKAIGCYYGKPGNKSSGASTRWADAATRAGIGESANLPTQTQDRLDEKAQNCGIYPIYAAFCAWDGGALETVDDYKAAYGLKKYPWGDEPRFAGASQAGAGFMSTRNVGDGDDKGYCACSGKNEATCPDVTIAGTTLKGCTSAEACNCSLDRCNFNFNYGRFALSTALGETFDSEDYSAFVAPPGRYPSGVSSTGHMDLAGNLFEMTSTLSSRAPIDGKPETAVEVTWTKNGSFEVHTPGAGFPKKNALTKYGKAGLRCVRP